MDSNEDYLDSLLNSVMMQDSKQGADSPDMQINKEKAAEPLDTATGNSELDEIDDLLKKSDQGLGPDDDMLAMLQNADQGEDSASDNDAPDAFDIFASEGMEEDPEYESEEDRLPADIGDAGDFTADGGIGGSADQEPSADEGNEQAADGGFTEELLQDTGNEQDADGAFTEELLQDAGGPFAGELPQDVSEPVDIGSPELGGAVQMQAAENDGAQKEAAGKPKEYDMDALLDGLMLDDQSEMDTSMIDEGPGNDLLSLDSLQSEEEEPYEDDSDIQSEIDALLGVVGGSGRSEAKEAGPGMQDIFADMGQDNDTTQDLAAGPDTSPSEEQPADGNAEKGGRRKKRRRKEKPEKPAKAGILKGKKARAKKAQTLPETEQAPEAEPSPETEQSPEAEQLLQAVQLPETEESGAAGEGPEEKKAKRKKERVKKEKEPGFLSKVFGGLFEEIGEEDSDQSQEINMSDENRDILAEMDAEQAGKSKAGKKKKAGKGKKAAKGKKKQPGGEEEGEEQPSDDKKAKKKKEKKPKKEKKEKAQENEAPAKKLPRAKVFSIFAVCITLLAVVVILSFIVPAQSDLKRAREAYYEQDYLTVFQNMDGKDLNDSDYILYMRSVMILHMQNKLDSYPIYRNMGKELVALNELMLAVDYYQTNRAAAEGYGALGEMTEIYAQVLSLLQDNYQVSEQEAIEIFALDDLAYNQKLYYLIHGTEFTLPEAEDNSQDGSGAAGGQDQSDAADGQGEAPMEDLIPEEDEMLAEVRQPENVAQNGQDGQNVQSGQGAQDGQNVQNGQGAQDEQNVQDGQDISDGQDAQNGQDGLQPAENGTEAPGDGSLSRGDGSELYSGEVEDGKVVLQ